MARLLAKHLHTIILSQIDNFTRKNDRFLQLFIHIHPNLHFTESREIYGIKQQN